MDVLHILVDREAQEEEAASEVDKVVDAGHGVDDGEHFDYDGFVHGNRLSTISSFSGPFQRFPDWSPGRRSRGEQEQRKEAKGEHLPASPVEKMGGYQCGRPQNPEEGQGITSGGLWKATEGHGRKGAAIGRSQK